MYVHKPNLLNVSLADIPVSHKQPQVSLTRHTYSKYLVLVIIGEVFSVMVVFRFEGKQC